MICSAGYCDRRAFVRAAVRMPPAHEAIRRCEHAIKGAVANCYLENTEDERSKFLLGLTVQGARNVEAIELLVNGKFYTQALGLCRSGLEAVAIAHFVTKEDGNFKLLEKGFWERWRTELKEFSVPHNSDVLGKYIKDMHSGSTKELQVKKLLAAFERTTMPGSNGNLFYAGYRKLCTYTHPDFDMLRNAVKIRPLGLRYLTYMRHRHGYVCRPILYAVQRQRAAMAGQNWRTGG